MQLEAPPVVAVVVTCDPGPWFEETLASLADQDYPKLHVVIVDAASTTDVRPRVAAVLPQAEVRQLPTNPGYGPSVNAALDLTAVSSHLLICHDDVVPAPDAVRLMVEEAYRSNAGIVAPKLVAWDQPDRLLQVGMAMTRGGAQTARVERGELDQEQHDAVRDVFVAPGAFSLVRSDLFATLGGFDPAITVLGEDVDLCWRAHLLGARVIVAPGARVRHLEALSSGERGIPGNGIAGNGIAGKRIAGQGIAGQGGVDQWVAHVALARRHQLRTVLKAYRARHLAVVLPQLALLSFAEVLVARFTHRPALARALSGSWRWNLARRKDLRSARSALQAVRSVSDHDLRHLQLGVGAGLFARRQAPSASGWPGWHGPWLAGTPALELAGAGGTGAGGNGVASPARAVFGSVAAPAPTAPSGGTAPSRVPGAAAWVVVLALLVLGSRQVATTAFPAVGQLSPWPAWTTLLGHFASGWRSTGLGASAPGPLAFALMGVAGMVVFGHMGFLQHLAVLGTLPLGALGAWSLAKPLGSWGRVVTMVTYAVVPLPYGALGLGRWDVLVAYAAAPWVLRLLAGATGIEPYGPARGAGRSAGAGAGAGLASPVRRVSLARRGLALAVLLAVVSAFVPSEVVVVLVCAVGLIVGSALSGRVERSARALVVAVMGVLGAVVLSEPWLLGLLHPGPHLAAFGPPGTVGAAGVGQLLSLRMGGVGVTPLAWGLVAAACLPLLIGRGWRFAWACRAWGVALACWSVAWIGGKGWLGISIPTGVLVAGASAAVALSVGLGLVAFQADLVRFRFGWRQGASLLAAAGVAVGTFSFLSVAFGGRWRLPSQGFNQVLSYMPAKATKGPFRVLWLGNPQALPMGSWSMGSGLAFATSENGPPDATFLLPPGGEGAAHLLATDLRLATGDLTTRLGHLLAPLAVRYIVVPNQLDPGPGAPRLPPPATLVRVLGAQEDLLQIPSDPSILIFANVAWAPQRAELSPAAAADSASTAPAAALDAPLAGSTPVLSGPAGGASFRGALPTGTVYLSAGSSRWVLTEAGGTTLHARPAFGWADSYDVARAGPATLSFSTPPLYLLAIAVEGLLWVLAVACLVGRRRVR